MRLFVVEDSEKLLLVLGSIWIIRNYHYYSIWLVVWNIVYFSIYWEFHNPN